MTTWVRVARVGKPSGVAGRVTVQVFTDDPSVRFAAGAQLARDDTGAAPLTVAGSGRSGARWVLAFEGVGDRDAAERLRDQELYAAVADAEATPGEDEWYDWQLVGMRCRLVDGTDAGEVTAVEHPPAHDLLVLRRPDGRTVRVPFVAQIVPRIDAGGVVLDPPGGLLDAEEAEG